MKTAAKVILIVAAIFVAAGICMSAAGVYFGANPKLVAQNIGNAVDFNVGFRAGSDGFHIFRGNHRDDDYYDDYYDDGIFDDDIID